jgi:phosphoglycerate dehydrogenase-like enzyme
MTAGPQKPAVAGIATTARDTARRPRVLAAMEPNLLTRLFTPPAMSRLAELVELVGEHSRADFQAPRGLGFLAGTEVLLTCWGAPSLDGRILDSAPELRAVVHAAGSVKEIITDACWARGITVSSAAWANARPVAEYTLAAVLTSNKRLLELRDLYAADRSSWHGDRVPPDIGNQGRTIGVVGASYIGRRLIELLHQFDFEILLADPYVSETEAASLGARLVDLDELCSSSDVVTLHAPALPETRHMIDARRLDLMRDGATLINTARGALVEGDALTATLAAGRLYAVLDTTEPEVLPDDSRLYDLPNVVLTPHVAGAAGSELRLLGDAALGELSRYVSGLEFAHPVSRQDLDRIA